MIMINKNKTLFRVSHCGQCVWPNKAGHSTKGTVPLKSESFFQGLACWAANQRT